MGEAGLQEIETYVAYLHNTVSQNIATRPIMDLCLAAGWRPGARVSKRRWEQESIDMEGIREAARLEEAERDKWERAGEETDSNMEY